ncbi:hypothetical protein [Halospeciosus flavus]|uniref:Transcription factor zinc-finger domain-containing protein n=1 Tax=Halospeciosus flavus TaxID=3032283 RepID=A0ABD5Z1Y9_9EURY|nr:hypothetical protein [Halospeciosus flavus]
MAVDGEPEETELIDVVERVEDVGRDDGEGDAAGPNGQCPRCGGTLSSYVFFGYETVACDDCGFLDADADHTAHPVERESWDAALERFRETYSRT